MKLGQRVRAPGKVSRVYDGLTERHLWKRSTWAKPVEGIFVGDRSYQTGKSHWGDGEDEGSYFVQDGTVRIALIALNPRHNPVPVLYSECELADVEDD